MSIKWGWKHFSYFPDIKESNLSSWWSKFKEVLSSSRISWQDLRIFRT